MFLAIIVIGSIPGARSDIAEIGSGLVLHSVAYATIAFLLFTGSHASPPRRALKAVLTVAAMGAIDEFIQTFLPYRHGAVLDWLVDCNAALLMSALLWSIWPKRGQ